MGAHLACVSCSQVKDKDNEPYKSTVSSNHKVEGRPATSLNQVHLNLNNDSTHIEANDVVSRTSALDIYNVIKQNTRNNNDTTNKLDETGDEEDFDENDGIEKAAKAIVDMSLFITTKIIYPAYVKYLEMDEPELYEQYYGQGVTSDDGEGSGRDSCTRL